VQRGRRKNLFTAWGNRDDGKVAAGGGEKPIRAKNRKGSEIMNCRVKPWRLSTRADTKGVKSGKTGTSIKLKRTVGKKELGVQKEIHRQGMSPS